MIDNLNKYIGLPYEQYDCWQIICYYYEHEFGILLPRFEGEYQDGYDSKRIAHIYTREMALEIWPRVDKPHWPDLIVFRIDGDTWHAGIIVGNRHMLHTQLGCNSVIENFTGYRWKNRFYGFYRYNGKQ